jgi:hypothetical protein
MLLARKEANTSRKVEKTDIRIAREQMAACGLMRELQKY